MRIEVDNDEVLSELDNDELIKELKHRLKDGQIKPAELHNLKNILLNQKELGTSLLDQLKQEVIQQAVDRFTLVELEQRLK